ncbi:DUF3526 domain-containing protein [Pseudoduganella chitinolytica]|uniref:DUF3526 domain-containing protein n=1 Tax=Pseudoduganella chitinolytica TaxID=34070 RepID=A0ABY8BDC0_9BURK|nr:DUF3526 domain-containing protein [Pseudoduganella chitinolytica]WEF33701.1 DUF3526 domain-containing protein [Pseudoduganella chitinolytica]
MSPLLAIEARRLWREPRLRMVAALAPALLLLVFLASWRDAAQLTAERQRFAAAERARWLAQGDKDPHSAAHFGVWAVKPASPLAVLEPGIEPYVGLAVWLEAHKRNEMIFRPGQDAHPIVRGATSVAQLLGLLGPLFALLLGFAGFAQDRQRGTLRLALGNGAPAGRLLLARFVVLAGVLVAVVLLPAALLGAGALLALPDGGWRGGVRLAMWCALHVPYLLAFLLLALAVALRAPSARTALGLLLATWLALCVLLPRVAGNAVELLAPAPPYQEVRRQVEAAAPAYESADRWEARRRTLQARAAGGVDLRAALLDQSERDSHVVFDRLLGRFYDAIEQQDEVFGRLGVLTPAVALQAAGSAIAGTDFRQHRHFIDAAEHYRRGMVNRLNGELMQRASHAPVKGGSWESVPAFAYRPPTPVQAAIAAAMPVAALLAWCALAALAAWRAARGVRP